MMGKTHKAIGALSATTLFIGTDIIFKGNLNHVTGTMLGITAAGTILGGMLGGMLPDIDEPESRIGAKLWFISWPIYLFHLILLILSALLPNGKMKMMANKFQKNTGHRYITHSLITWGIVCICFGLAGKYLFNYNNFVDLIARGLLFGTCVGMLSHIIADMCSGSVPLFCPIIEKRYSMPGIHIAMNGLTEHLIRYASTLACCGLIYIRYF